MYSKRSLFEILIGTFHLYKNVPVPKKEEFFLKHSFLQLFLIYLTSAPSLSLFYTVGLLLLRTL